MAGKTAELVDWEAAYRERGMELARLAEENERMKRAFDWDHYHGGFERGWRNHAESRSKPSSDVDNMAWLIGYRAGWESRAAKQVAITGDAGGEPDGR